MFIFRFIVLKVEGKGKATPLTDLDRPLWLQEFEAPRISRQLTHEGGKAISPMHRPSLPLKNYIYFFTLQNPIA